MIKIINPTEADIKGFIFEGHKVEILAGDSALVNDTIAAKLLKTFEFLQVESVEELPTVPVKEDDEVVDTTDTQEDETEEDKVDLGKLSREDLDKIAEESGLIPSDYANKPTLIEAITEKFNA